MLTLTTAVLRTRPYVRGDAYASQTQNLTAQLEVDQKLSFNALTAKHFTTLRAGLALTLISLPKAIRFPALVAGLCLSTTRQIPGRMILPFFFTALTTTPSKASITFFTSFFATPLPFSSARAVSLLFIALPFTMVLRDETCVTGGKI